MPGLLDPALAILAALLLLPAAATAQGRTQRYPELGLTLSRPPGFEAVPLPPEEREVVLRYLESAPAGTARRVRPGCDFVALEPGVGRVEAYFERSLSGWKRTRRRGRAERWGHQTRAFDLEDEQGRRVGYAHVWESPQRSLVYFAVCALEDEREVLAPLIRLAERARLEEPRLDERLRYALERRYAGGRWSDPAHRIAAHLALVDGWEAHDSTHYVVVHHGLAAARVQEVIEGIEVLREDLGRRFAAHLARDVVSTVRLCRDREEYLAYGGPPQFAGYWNAAAEELVLYDAGSEGPEATRLTLYHELFHQFVYHATGGVTPHSFFGEGWADYVAGAVLERGRIARIEPHPWRAQQLAELVAAQDVVPWKEFLAYDPRTFYERLSPAYAQAWSLVAFLESAPVQRDPRLRGRLGRYFETLREAFARERAVYGPNAPPWLPASAHERARGEALSAFLEGLDMAVLEEGWKRFVDGL